MCMRVEMLMPQMGESIAEATILKWLKKVGDIVEKDETILEISTDKVDSEIPSPASGVITELLANEGQTVDVKSVIAVIETDKAAAGTITKTAKKSEPVEKIPVKPSLEGNASSLPAKKESAPPQGNDEALPSKEKEKTVPTPAPDIKASEVPTQVGDRFYSPLVRTLAAQYGLTMNELQQIRGTGSNGRVTKQDVMNYLNFRGTSGPAAGGAGRSSLPPPAARPQYDEKGLRVEAMDNMRQRIAEHMVRSKATSAHVYTVAECDFSNVVKWRAARQDEFFAREGFKLSFTPFFLEAATKALVQYPQINASIEGTNIILKRDVNLGCAVALGTTGLIVPVIKNAQDLSFVGIARQLNDFASRARNKQLRPDDVQGGTFTVTNPGTFGSIIGYPIINQPQLAILAVGAIKKRPVVVNDMIAVRDIVYLTLSYDHRVIDGSLGGTFLQYIVKYLESWDQERGLY